MFLLGGTTRAEGKLTGVLLRGEIDLRMAAEACMKLGILCKDST